MVSGNLIFLAADSLYRTTCPLCRFFTLVTEYFFTPIDFFLIQDINNIPDYK